MIAALFNGQLVYNGDYLNYHEATDYQVTPHEAIPESAERITKCLNQLQLFDGPDPAYAGFFHYYPKEWRKIV